MRQIILDTETTGLSVEAGHRIIEVAAVELINRKLSGKYYHQYICPQRKIDPGAQAIHGITEAFLADKPLFEHIASPLLTFIQDAELIIHNAPFDVAFLESEFRAIHSDFRLLTHCKVLDTLALARKKHPGQANNLDALCKRYKIDHSKRQLHGALLDTHLLAAVYLAMTGGQTNLFGEEDSGGAVEQNVPLFEQIQVQDTLTLNVIIATSDELQSHHAQLEKIKQQNGGLCLWPLETV